MESDCVELVSLQYGHWTANIIVSHNHHRRQYILTLANKNLQLPSPQLILFKFLRSTKLLYSLVALLDVFVNVVISKMSLGNNLKIFEEATISKNEFIQPARKARGPEGPARWER